MVTKLTYHAKEGSAVGIALFDKTTSMMARMYAPRHRQPAYATNLLGVERLGRENQTNVRYVKNARN